jgi:hypothetical protein
MRTAADTLRNLADRFERQNNPAANQPHGNAPNQANDPNKEPRT